MTLFKSFTANKAKSREKPRKAWPGTTEAEEAEEAEDDREEAFDEERMMLIPALSSPSAAMK